MTLEEQMLLEGILLGVVSSYLVSGILALWLAEWFK